MSGRRGVVVWLTGLPSSGKSRLALRAADALTARGEPACVLDGDAVRAALRPSPGYDERGRDDFYATLSGLAALLAQQGLTVLVAATAHRARYREAARAAAPRFVEVFVDVPLAVCRERDSKGLYARAEEGSVTQMPGVAFDYEAPLAPDVVARGGEDADACRAIVALVASR